MILIRSKTHVSMIAIKLARIDSSKLFFHGQTSVLWGPYSVTLINAHNKCVRKKLLYDMSECMQCDRTSLQAHFLSSRVVKTFLMTKRTPWACACEAYLLGPET